jgi:quinol monooxygenase YgiN
VRKKATSRRHSPWIECSVCERNRTEVEAGEINEVSAGQELRSRRSDGPQRSTSAAPGRRSMAFVRVGKFKAQSEAAAELCRIYETEAIPAIRAAGGNVSAVLLRQHQQPDTFLAITIWKTSADAESYEKSGTAAQMVNKIRHAFAGPPTLTTYDAYGI